MAFPADWSRRVSVTGASPPATLSGYVALITGDNLPTEIWTTALNGGGDLRVALNSDGTSPIPLEVVSFDTSLQTAVLWVRFPTYSAAARECWIFYGKAAETQPAVTDPLGRNAVWADFDAVYHFSETSGNWINSVGNGFDIVSTNAGGTLTRINEGISFSGDRDTTNKLEVPNSSSSGTFWNNQTNSLTTIIRVAIGDSGSGPDELFEEGGSANGYSIGYRSAPNKIICVWAENSNRLEMQSSSTFMPDNSQKINIATRLNASQVDLFVNGSQEDSSLYADNLPSHNSSTTLGGRSINPVLGAESALEGSQAAISSGVTSFNGGFFELWRTGISLSSDWLSTNNDNQSAPSTFWTKGTPENTTEGGTGTQLTVNFQLNKPLVSSSITPSVLNPQINSAFNIDKYSTSGSLNPSVATPVLSGSIQLDKLLVSALINPTNLTPQLYSSFNIDKFNVTALINPSVITPVLSGNINIDKIQVTALVIPKTNFPNLSANFSLDKISLSSDIVPTVVIPEINASFNLNKINSTGNINPAVSIPNISGSFNFTKLNVNSSISTINPPVNMSSSFTFNKLSTISLLIVGELNIIMDNKTNINQIFYNNNIDME